MLSKYEDQYPVMGHPAVMMPKLIFDTFINHSGQVLIMTQNRLTDFEFMQAVDDDVDRIYRVSMNVQKLFREWHELEERFEADPGGIGVWPMMQATNAVARAFDDAALQEELHNQADCAEALAVALFHKAAGVLPEPPDPADPSIPTRLA